MPFRRRVHLVAEGPRLGVEIDEVGEGPAGEEIVLDEMKRALDARRAVGITLFVGPKPKPKRSAKAAISGAGTIRAPVPAATTTCVLSIMHVAAAPVRYSSASVRNTLQ